MPLSATQRCRRQGSRLLEPLDMLCIDQAMKRGRGRDFAFALVNMR